MTESNDLYARLSALSRTFADQLLMRYRYATDKSSVFKFHKHYYNYFSHDYNTTWLNERAVEAPIVWSLVQRYRGSRILEVGNVLSHYYSSSHEVIDKYEKADGVTNVDVVDFRPAGKYDLIVSISTLEHVGWDEDIKDDTKIPRALDNLRSLLAPGGKLIVTLPLGYNKDMDRLLKDGRIRFTEQYYLKRITKENRWAEVRRDAVSEISYGSPYPYANGLLIGIDNGHYK